MIQLYSLSKAKRAVWEKICASFLMLSINLTVVGAAIFTAPQVVTATVSTFFSEPFPSNNGNVVTDWTETENNSADAKLSTAQPLHASPISAKGHARLRKGASIEKTISTIGLRNIRLSYYWRGDENAEGSGRGADYLHVYWKPVSSGDFSLIDTHALNSASWAPSDTIALSSDADNTSIILKFVGDTTANDEQARVDDVTLDGDNDLTPPDVSISAPVADGTTGASGTITYSTGDASRATCSLDGAPVECDLSGPYSFTLSDGPHVFVVTGYDVAGNSSSASVTWHIDATGPGVTITDGPSGTVETSEATFTFTTDPIDPDAVFQCQLDGAMAEPCNSPVTYSDLANGEHTFTVHATDTFGNVGSDASRTWTVVVPICGNGIQEKGEECDDGNDNNSDSCTNECKSAHCGDGIVNQEIEQCDDGNDVSTDSCTNQCQNYVPPIPQECPPGTTGIFPMCMPVFDICDIMPGMPGCPGAPVCGNERIDIGETCDDGNTAGGDGCSSMCQTEIDMCPAIPGVQVSMMDCMPIFDMCSIMPMMPGCPGVSICGNGTVETPETCDDGNQFNGDGCSAMCRTEIPVEKGHVVIVKHTVGGNGEFNFTLNHSDDRTINASIETEEGTGSTDPIAVTPNVSYTVDESVPEGWSFTSVNCVYDDESTGNVVEEHPTQHVINVDPGETVTCTYTNTKLPRSCQLEGYKYNAEGKPVAGLAVGVLSKPVTFQGEGESQGQIFVERKGAIMVTKTDETGHYCLNGVPSGSDRVFEWPGAGTENDHVTVDGDNAGHLMDSFFDVFPEVTINPGAQQPAQVNSFFDVFTEIDGGRAQKVNSFFDVFTELSLDGSSKPADSFFDVFTELRFGGEDGGHHAVNFYNKPIPQVTGGGGGGTSYTYGCMNSSASNYNPAATSDDGTCQLATPPVSPTPPSGGNNGNSGEVLGASTETPSLPLPPGCTAYLTTYMKMGGKNNKDEVIKLQTFLNEEMGAALPVTGNYGVLTKAWVKKFQKKYHADILQPWLDAGFRASVLQEGTGVVYKMTKYKINMMKCASLAEPKPTPSFDE